MQHAGPDAGVMSCELKSTMLHLAIGAFPAMNPGGHTSSSFCAGVAILTEILQCFFELLRAEEDMAPCDPRLSLWAYLRSAAYLCWWKDAPETG